MAEADLAAGEHAAAEVGRATGELSVVKVDLAAGELGVVEADHTAGEHSAAESDVPAAELGAAEADLATGGHGAGEVATVEDHAREVEVQALPGLRLGHIGLEVRGDDPDDDVADLSAGPVRGPFSRGSLVARVRIVGQAQVGTEHVNARLPVLGPVISQTRHGVHPASRTAGGLSLPNCPAAVANRSFRVRVRCSASVLSSCSRCSLRSRRVPRRLNHCATLVTIR